MTVKPLLYMYTYSNFINELLRDRFALFRKYSDFIELPIESLDHVNT